MFDNYVNKLMAGDSLKKPKNMCKNTFLFYIITMITNIEVMQEKEGENSLGQICLRSKKELLQDILNRTNEGVFDIKGD